MIGTLQCPIWPEECECTIDSLSLSVSVVGCLDGAVSAAKRYTKALEKDSE